MNKIFILILAISVLVPPVIGQISFKDNRIKNDPVDVESDLEIEEKMKIHKDFLDKASLGQDTIKQIFGNIYLYFDCLEKHDFTEASRYILEAEKVANQSGNQQWLGWVIHRKGALHVFLRNFEEAILQYKRSESLCKEARDSLCVAFNLEQLSSMYGQLKDFEKAQECFDLALPLLEKFGDDGSLAVALANYGNLLQYQKRYQEALPYHERAVELNEKLNRPYKKIQSLHNIGELNLSLGRYNKALEIYQECIRINDENNWPERKIYNYHGLYQAYEKMGDLQKALDYNRKYYKLKDSIIGAQTQLKVADLEAKYDSQEKELDLQKSRAELMVAERSLERAGGFFIFLLLLAAFGIYLWRKQMLQAKREKAENEENLKRLTRILLEKNTVLLEMEEMVSVQATQHKTTPNPEIFEENLYNQRILTEEDWAAFKVYFEKTYPGYLSRLRSTYPALSEAEERLFLFIKLNLTRKEAAAILGISADSVKKTRYRVRKRLELDEEASLDDYIRSF
ncbi:MAG: hypothetical protein DHS20C18_15130 [Saprospiraceae bacterium]|nr:MAG: hypothetical protein DHS20C18_15130 [Saprospiraceae bacterium]